MGVILMPNRRRAPGVPAAGSTLWLTPESIQQSAGTVTSWTDMSGNGRNLTTVTGSPAYTASGGPGGLPAIDFDGTDDFLTRAGVLEDTVMSAAAYTYFIVLIVDAVDTNSGTLGNNDGPFGGASGARITCTLRSTGDVNFHHVDSGGVKTNVLPAALTTGVKTLLMGRYDGSTLFGKVNATNGAGTAAGSALNINELLNIGRNNGSATYYLDGKVSEMIFYNTHLSLADRTQTLAYLSGKYGIAVMVLASWGPG